MKKVSYSIKNLDWMNTSVLLALPLASVITIIWHVQAEGFNPWLIIPAFLMYAFTTFSISGGYHRLFAHRAYKANGLMKFFYLVFGAASIENSALKWAADHRRHHTNADTDADPYDISKGFFFAHMGWIMLKEQKNIEETYPKDLVQDKMVMWQHNHYIAITLVMNVLLPLFVGYAMGSPIGGLAIIGFARITFVHHITFCINSLCHMIGTRPYDTEQSARDSALMALVTFGEGYHNFHHTFQTDYRNGLRWYHWDPTKWIVSFTTWIGWTTDLKRASESAILKALMNVQQKKLEEKIQKKFNWQDFKVKMDSYEFTRLKELKEKVQVAQKRMLDLKVEYNRMKEELKDSGHEKLVELQARLAEARYEFKKLYEEWLDSISSDANVYA